MFWLLLYLVSFVPKGIFEQSSSRLISARNGVKFWQTFNMSTTSNQFESHIFRSNFLKLAVAAQDYDILNSSHFPENPGWPKWTFSSPKTFKLLSGEQKVIQLITWYHVLFLGPWSIHYLFQNTRKFIRLSETMLQTLLTPSPADRQLDWGGGCSTGTLPFKDKEKRTVTSAGEGLPCSLCSRLVFWMYGLVLVI